MMVVSIGAVNCIISSSQFEFDYIEKKIHLRHLAEVFIVTLITRILEKNMMIHIK